MSEIAFVRLVAALPKLCVDVCWAPLIRAKLKYATYYVEMQCADSIQFAIFCLEFSELLVEVIVCLTMEMKHAKVGYEIKRRVLVLVLMKETCCTVIINYSSERHRQ